MPKRTFIADVTGRTAAEVEQAALIQAASFFEVGPDQLHLGEYQAYTGGSDEERFAQIPVLDHNPELVYDFGNRAIPCAGDGF